MGESKRGNRNVGTGRTGRATSAAGSRSGSMARRPGNLRACAKCDLRTELEQLAARNARLHTDLAELLAFLEELSQVLAPGLLPDSQPGEALRRP